MRLMVSSIVVQYTELLQAGEYDLWGRLRELLEGQGLDPDRTVVVDLLAGGPDHEDGQVISADGRVFKFSLFYDRELEDGAQNAVLHGWTDITDRWQTGSRAKLTEGAFAWMAQLKEQS